MKPYYEHGGQTIYHGDCRDVLPQLQPVELLFTSPPYLNQREYGIGAFSWDELVPPALRKVRLTEQGQMFVNLGLVHRDGEVVMYWESLLAAMREVGMPLFGWYVWDQGDGLPGNWNGRLAPAFEFVFHFTRNARQPNKTKPCVKAGQKVQGSTFRKKDGTTEELNSNGKVYSQFKIPDAVTRVRRQNPSSAFTTEHPAMFPEQFAGEFIAAYSEEGQTVLDPFMGSGSTLRAAKDQGRKAIGIELEERYCEIAAKRLAQEVLFA